MPRRSAGLLLFRRREGSLELLLVHPGGPFWARKDDGAWSVPKGEYDEGEDPLAAARREFKEETGSAPPDGELLELGEITQAGGKKVLGFASAGEFDIADLRSSTFEMEWPPRSGRRQVYPEVDRAGWFDPDEARRKLIPAQAAFVDRLIARLDGRGSQPVPAISPGS